MGTVISELFEESGMSVQAFADKAGLKYGTAYDIAKGVSKVENIGAGAFVRIAHVFGKTADELLSDIPQLEPSPDLSPDEQELVDCYRATIGFGKRVILNTARMYRDELAAADGWADEFSQEFHDIPPHEFTSDDADWLLEEAKRKFEEGE